MDAVCKIHAYIFLPRREIFAVRFAISVFSLDTLDISVKYEIYESKIFTNNVMQYLWNLSFSVKKNGPAVIVRGDLEYLTWIRQKNSWFSF